jgi:hypothetical protein
MARALRLCISLATTLTGIIAAERDGSRRKKRSV